RDPEIAVAIAQDLADRGIKVLHAGVGLESTIASAEQPAVLGADPQCAIVVFEHRAHSIAATARRDLDFLEATRGAAIEAADVGRRPNGPVVADVERANR